MLTRVPPTTATSRRAVALYALLATFTAYADAEKLDSLDQVRAFAASVVEQADSDEAKAFDMLREHTLSVKDYSTVPVADLDAIAQRFTSATAQRTTAMGKPTGNVEFVGQKQLGENLTRVSYLQHRVRAPMLWTFDFYRTGGGWALTGFNADDSTSDMLAR